MIVTSPGKIAYATVQIAVVSRRED